MAKYIDLLRAHQNQKSESPSSNKGLEQEYDEVEVMLEVYDEDDLPPELTPDETLLLPEELPSEVEEPATPPAAAAPSPQASPEISSWLTNLITHLQQLFADAQQKNRTSIQRLSNEITELLRRLDANSELHNDLELDIIKRTAGIRESGENHGDLVQKSVIMMLYALKMGQRLHLQTEELRSHILAAMLHHIGMAQVPSSIRLKKERLTQDELDEIRKASANGHDYLNECGVTDPIILLATKQSNERFDGSGPSGLSATDISFSARMIGLLSMFEALIHFRPYRHRLLPRDAIRELVNHHKTAFDPVMLKALIESISLYPVGTYIQLNTGDVGLVTQVHDRLPLRPKVLINMDAHGNKIPERTINLKEQPNLMIQHCMYEEELAELKESSHQERNK